MSNDKQPALNPASLTPQHLAQLLSRASGESITVTMLEEDLRAGCPKNADGTIHLVHYAVWLTQERQR